MIHDLSTTLHAILDDNSLGARFPELLAANIAFDRPDDNFQPQAPAALDLFLYDIRENVELRNNEPIVQRNGHQATIQPPPRRIDCSYLVTAWPTGAPPLELREHQLLGQALEVLAGYPTIPHIFLQGSLVDQEPPLPMITPQVDGLKSPADFWTAMGNRLRASFTVTITLSVSVLPAVTGPIVTTKLTGFDAGEGVIDETLVQIGGRVLGPSGDGIAEAVVDILDAGLRAITDADGNFSFTRVPRGDRDFRVVAVGFQPFAQTVNVPSRSEDYDFNLIPL